MFCPHRLVVYHAINEINPPDDSSHVSQLLSRHFIVPFSYRFQLFFIKKPFQVATVYRLGCVDL